MKKLIVFFQVLLVLLGCSHKDYSQQQKQQVNTETEQKIEKLLAKMTLEEKIYQMSQINSTMDYAPELTTEAIKKGLGSIINIVDPKTINELQKIAIEESPSGIPLIIGRDVIHGFRTIFPIPLGQAATWNAEMVEKGSAIAANEAFSQGVNWTFAPMLDIARDPRWGRIAESHGEDPFLGAAIGAAMIRGFQGNNLKDKGTIAACAKHYVGYGAAEGGRDYNTTVISENDLRNVYLPAFKAAIDNEVATFMSGFNELNGIPVTGNTFTLKTILRKEWRFNGFVVSDWNSITEMIAHGFAEDDKNAAEIAVNAGVDMEMASSSYVNHLKTLIDENKVSLKTIDESVKNILRVKIKLGLFESPYVQSEDFPPLLAKEHLSVAKEICLQSLVLLENKDNFLPLSENINKVAVIGPMANAPLDQMGTWVFDGKKENTITPLVALKDFIGGDKVIYAKGLKNSRINSKSGFAEAVQAAKSADVVLFFAGEEAILTGEAHCRGNLSLPGAQSELLKELAATGKPVVLVVMAGRPLAIGNDASISKSVIYAWHPGTMGGPAIVDLLFGKAVPSGKLPVTFPKGPGQIPFYYAHKNTGRPAPKNVLLIDSIPEEAGQTSLGNTSFYLDYGSVPLYPFGYGLSYTNFEYSDLIISANEIAINDNLTVKVKLKNTGNYDGTEVVQLYIRDLTGSITRPVKELKGFKRIDLKAGEEREVTFVLVTKNLGFYKDGPQLIIEPGKFQVFIGGNSETKLMKEFVLK